MTGAIAIFLNTKSDRAQSTTDYTWPYASTRVVPKNASLRELSLALLGGV